MIAIVSAMRVRVVYILYISVHGDRAYRGSFRRVGYRNDRGAQTTRPKHGISMFVYCLNWSQQRGGNRGAEWSKSSFSFFIGLPRSPCLPFLPRFVGRMRQPYCISYGLGKDFWMCCKCYNAGLRKVFVIDGKKRLWMHVSLGLRRAYMQ